MSLSEEQARSYMHKLLAAMSAAGGSDLFISRDFPPSMKSQGAMKPLTTQKLTAEVTRELAHSMMNERQREEFARELECNFAMSDSRGRALSRQRLRAAACVGMVIRTIADRDPELREAEAARDSQGSRDDQARPGAGGRRHRLGQVDLAGGDDRPPQPHVGRPHHHGRRPGGVRAPVADVADHAPRGRRRHALAGITR